MNAPRHRRGNPGLGPVEHDPPPPTLPDACEQGQRLAAVPGVLGVRSGFHLGPNDWPTARRVIHLAVAPGADRVEVAAQVDSLLGSEEYDLASATPLEQWEALRPNREASSRSHTVPESARPSCYRPPAGPSLRDVSGPMTVSCHVGPDGGWANLRTFLREGVSERLTVGMYDFTAPHVLEALRAAMREAEGDLVMVLDPRISLGSRSGEGVKALDLEEETVVSRLRRSLRDRFRFAWAWTGSGGPFASSYHLKVAIADGRRTWLSSGNWQSSNQPNLDPLGADTGVALGRYNREWHVVLEHSGLSSTLEAFLLHDLEQASLREEAGRSGAELPCLRLDVEALEELEEPDRPRRLFSPSRFRFSRRRPLRVTPLLSPDNYARAVLELVQGATRRLLIQNQYIRLRRNPAPIFRELLETVREKGRSGVEVKIILRDLPDARLMLDELQELGFDLEWVKLMLNTHTKGLVVDSQAVVVGSHNWSSDGVCFNRDASLLFHDRAIAGYFEDVFMHDWERLARQRLWFERHMPTLVSGEEAARPGSAVVGWDELHAE